MSLTPWKNLPDTSTPITAENLKNDPNELNKEIFYKKNDIYTISNQYYAGGCLTGGGLAINFTIILPKRTTKITSITATNLNVAVRVPSGGYGINGPVDNSKVTVNAFGENFVSLGITLDSAIEPNNMPVDTYIRSITLSFN